MSFSQGKSFRIRMNSRNSLYNAPAKKVSDRKPPKPENTKKIQNPPPQLGPRKYRKNTEKIGKRPENDNFWAVFIFFRYFFRISGGQPGVGDFVFFSYFRGLGVFGLCSRPAGSQQWNTEKTQSLSSGVRADFRLKGMRRATFQFSESRWFTEWPGPLH